VKITFDTVATIARTIACLAFFCLLGISYFTNIKIEIKTLAIILVLVIISFFPLLIEKLEKIK